MTTTYDNPAESTQGEPGAQDRPVRVGYLVTGLVFLGLAASWALWTADLVSAPALGFLVPLVLVVAGGAGLLALLLTAAQRRRVARRSVQPTSPYDDHPAHPDHETEEIR